MKKGIALIITVGFIAILGGIIAYMFSLTEGMFDEAVKVDAKNQRTILRSDIKRIIDNYAYEVKDSETLENFLLGMPPFYDKKSDLSLHVELEYLSNRVNINSLLVKNKIDKNIVEFLKNIGESYNILDISFLIALLEDTIDEDDVSRQALSEISREDIKFSNSHIVNRRHFKKILDYYEEVVKDSSVLNVPWNELIYFGKSQKSVVDCGRMSRELKNILRLNIEDFTGCVDLIDERDKKIVKKYNLKSFSKNDNFYVKVKILYQVGDFEDDMGFVYDLKTRKVD